MLRNSVVVLVAAIVALTGPIRAQDALKATAPPEPKEMVQLFSKDLQGWDGNPRLWSFKDGIVRGETKTVRQAIEHCATDHLSHRLVWLGFSQRGAVWFIYLMAFALGVAGIMLRNSTRGFDSVLGLMLGGSIVALVVALMVTAENRQAEMQRRMNEIHPLPAADETPEEFRKTA